ncbi:MAG: LysR substrate-binding domain-containing protein [Planctomycetota bacterium]
MNLSVRQLEYLVAVAEEGGFTRAAERCYVTQPTLSEQIRQLEAGLGLTLVERDHRRVRLTPAGEEVVARAREVLSAVLEVQDCAQRLQRPMSGTLRRGVIPTIAPYVLPRVYQALHRRFPGLRLYLHEDRTERLVERCTKGELEVLLLAREAELGETETLPLFEDPFYLVVPLDHHLRERARVREADLADENVLLLDDGHCLRDQVLELCERARADEVDDFRAGSLGTLVQMVSVGIGVTLLPAMAREVEVDSRSDANLALIPFEEPAPSRTVALGWRGGSSRVDEFRLLGEFIRERILAPVG